MERRAPLNHLLLVLWWEVLPEESDLLSAGEELSLALKAGNEAGFFLDEKRS